jgi:hypothetical protein
MKISLLELRLATALAELLNQAVPQMVDEDGKVYLADMKVINNAKAALAAFRKAKKAT